MRKSVFGVSDQGLDIAGCISTRDCYRLKSSDLELEGLYHLSKVEGLYYL